MVDGSSTTQRSDRRLAVEWARLPIDRVFPARGRGLRGRATVLVLTARRVHSGTSHPAGGRSDCRLIPRRLRS
jgi:hypothetical protein